MQIKTSRQFTPFSMTITFEKESEVTDFYTIFSHIHIARFFGDEKAQHIREALKIECSKVAFNNQLIKDLGIHEPIDRQG